MVDYYDRCYRIPRFGNFQHNFMNTDSSVQRGGSGSLSNSRRTNFGQGTHWHIIIVDKNILFQMALLNSELVGRLIALGQSYLQNTEKHSAAQ